MNSLENENVDNIKEEEVCRTCLTDDGHFFNITDIFDTFTLAQMIQNITNLQIHSSDGYTQFICLKCVKEVRRANKFRTKCLESNDSLVKIEIKTSEAAINDCNKEPEVEEIKQEAEESCDISDCVLDTEYDCKSEAPDVESDCDSDEDKSNDSDSENTKNDNKTSSKIIYDCPLCHALFFSDNVYKRHIKVFHPDNLKDECFNQKREPLGYILKRKRKNKIEYVYKCVSDKFLGNSIPEFKNHMIEHTGKKSVVCAECGFRTSNISLLKKHRIQKHIDEKKFSCTSCNYSCQTSNALKNHVSTHSTEKNHKCELCSLMFKNSPSLSRHKKEKHMTKSHVCSICQKAFFHGTKLRYHMYTHTGERPHICHYCGKRFAQAENMKVHVSLQHEPIKTMFKCDQCDYSTKQKSLLTLHKKRHNGEKFFNCSQCPYSSLQKYTLKLHMLRHTGEKTFTCDLCDYKGFTADCVKKHRKIHSGEKPFACTICDYSGKTNKSLKRHLQIHCTEPKFECPNCPYKTNVRDILARHIRRNCVIPKRGRRPTKLPDNILMNDEIKEDTEESFHTTSSNA